MATAAHQGKRSRRGDAAKRALILAAERLVGERGYRGVSLREIALAAGQRNNSAAQYHFGTKRGLVTAVLEYRMRPINEHRLAMLDEMAATGRDHDLHALIETLMVPWLDAVGNPEEPTHYARFLSQVAFIPDYSVMASVDPAHISGLQIVSERIVENMAHLPRRIAVQRAQVINRLMVSTMADQERTAHNAESWAHVAAPSDLIALGVAMVQAPATERATAEAAAFRSKAKAKAKADESAAAASAAAAEAPAAASNGTRLGAAAYGRNAQAAAAKESV